MPARLETTNSPLNRYLDSVKHLPTSPTLLIKMINLFRQPDRDIDEIVSLMQMDPAFTAEVLRRCNSSFFGSEEPVFDVGEAIFRLGFYEVYRMNVSMFGWQAVSKAKDMKCYPLQRLWEHCAITAIAAGTMARELEESEGVAFTAGLLHDVGKIALAAADGNAYEELLQQQGNFGPGLSEAEHARFGFNHGEVGALLLHRWGVPEEISVPVLCHHQMGWDGPLERVGAILNLADQMAHCIQDNTAEKPCQLPEAMKAMVFLNVTPERAPAIENAVRTEVKRLLSLFSVQGMN